ncbi:MAG: hypothetical protein KDC90_19410, partial [Ignavibacteriae bacterium]|nr:hypothetical protein [Ignavibacteriota bacterium]
SNTKLYSINNTNGIQASGDKVIIKDGATSLVEFKNFDSGGGIKISEQSTITTPLNYLYNFNGDLYWKLINLSAASTAANNWTISGSNIYNANSGSVGIGASTFSGEKLNVTSTADIIRMESSTEDGWLSIFNNPGTGSQYIGYLGAFNGDNDIDIGTGSSNTTGNLNLVTTAIPRFIIANDGRAGLGGTLSNASLNVQGISGDLIALRVADPSGVTRFQVLNNGQVGINHSLTNVTTNIKGISGDYQYFRVEDPTGGELFSIFPSGTAIFYNNLTVNGTLSKGAGSFKIDHPLDPANKNLYHSFVESPDMMNVYNGNVILNGSGEATVTMEDWFEALNQDFRYQLTCIGGFAPVYIAEKINGNQFKIAGGTAGMEVSWQVTGIRHDAYANAHRIQVEEIKEPEARGKYLHPTAFGQPESAGISYSEKLERVEASKTN